jgi:cell division protein FtsI (penicillin-binding protein 3)
MRSWLTARWSAVVGPERPRSASDGSWRPAVKGRVLLLAGVLAIWTVVILARLIQLQVFQHEEMRARADQQQHEIRTPPAGRGDILDRNGRLLAYSIDAASIDGYPRMVADAAATARVLCDRLGDCSQADLAEITRRLGDRDKRWVGLRPPAPLTAQQVEAVRGARLSAIALIPETLRFYPHRDLAAHVVGYVGRENKGFGGIESRFDSAISGQAGRVLVQRDAHGTEMFTRVERAPTAGAMIELTLDVNLQHIAERELAAGIRAVGADAGTALVMDPNTGEILALANYPAFNPNTYNESAEVVRRNRAVQELYEPGSTFKIVTAAAALEEGRIRTTDLIDTSPGVIRFSGRVIGEDKGRNYGTLTFADVIVKSSNVGAARIALRVGAEPMVRYARRFGFGEALAPDFAGEHDGIVHSPARLSDSDLASMAMGYAVAVTPLQMAAAVSAIANGGLLYEPHIVRATIRDGVRTAAEPRVLRRAILPETARTLTAIMEDVVERGTAKNARLSRYRVAGKTGTAEKLENGVYSDTDYNVSFVGFVPSRRPVFTVVVVVDSPRTTKYGGTVAAPIFQRIAAAALQYAGVPPTVDPAPSVIVADDAPPRPAAMLPTLQRVGGRALMPDVRGLGARDALRLLSAAGLEVRLSGAGTVVSQTPEPGVPIDAGMRSALELRRAIQAPRRPAAPESGPR